MLPTYVRGYLTVGLADLTVKMGCSHYKLTREVERSAGGGGGGGGDLRTSRTETFSLSPVGNTSLNSKVSLCFHMKGHGVLL